MVRVVGIEPTLLAEHDFESCASTSSATPALPGTYSAPPPSRPTKFAEFQKSAALTLALPSDCVLSYIDGRSIEHAILDHLTAGAGSMSDVSSPEAVRILASQPL
jgi:hypothetical protein